MKGGGAQLDLDLLVSKKIFSDCMTNQGIGRKYLRAEWGAMAEICCLTSPRIRLAANDFLCCFLRSAVSALRFPPPCSGPHT